MDANTLSKQIERAENYLHTLYCVQDCEIPATAANSVSGTLHWATGKNWGIYWKPKPVNSSSLQRYDLLRNFSLADRVALIPYLPTLCEEMKKHTLESLGIVEEAANYIKEWLDKVDYRD